MKNSKDIKIYLRIIYAAMSLLFTFVLFFSIWILIKRFSDKNSLDREIKEINDILNFSGECQSTNTSSETKEPNTDYFNYLKTPFNDVDIKKLKNINSDTVGFLNILGTNINYPVVQTTDNEFYLNHSFKKSCNSSGWLFMDYRNNAESFGKNTVIYGHSNLDKTMFGSLSNFLREDFLQNHNGAEIKFINLSAVTNWKIVSVYTIPAENYYIKTDFKSDKNFKEWLKTITGRSIHDFGYKISSDDKIMTFSTCYKDEGNIRLVVHARKI